MKDRNIYFWLSFPATRYASHISFTLAMFFINFLKCSNCSVIDIFYSYYSRTKNSLTTMKVKRTRIVSVLGRNDVTARLFSNVQSIASVKTSSPYESSLIDQSQRREIQKPNRISSFQPNKIDNVSFNAKDNIIIHIHKVKKNVKETYISAAYIHMHSFDFDRYGKPCDVMSQSVQ